MAKKRDSISDTLSDCTTGPGSSLGARDDLPEIAALLQITVEELTQQRFMVDRKRLETLIYGEGNSLESASRFFERIMEQTKTYISWPVRLKLGAKSKKDPHVRIIGRAENVEVAKGMVLAELDTKSNRVIMKIDVSYTDHSHIIGKGGLTIKRVMELTGCHIHFPDSNRSHENEKSNQVSIAGDVRGVEKARAKVRELTPLIFSFELPILGSLGTLYSSPDLNSPYIKSLQETYNVQVMFRSRQKLNSTLVVVKGCELEVNKVKEATQRLIHHMCDTFANQVLVNMMMEISPQHHNIVLGKNDELVKGIMQRTSTQIVFMDPNDPNIPSLKKSHVNITGSIHNVYIARQQLIGSLPVVLTFNVPENSPFIESERLSKVMNNYDVIISTRNKPKQNLVSIIIMGMERNVGEIYDARRQLIASNEEPVQPEIPQMYLINYSGFIFKEAWLHHVNRHQRNHDSHPPFGNNMMLSSPLVLEPSPSTPAMSVNQDYGWSNRLRTSHLPQHLMAHLPVHRPYLSDQLGHFSYSSLSLPDMQLPSSFRSNTSSVSSPTASPRTISPVPHSIPEQTKLDYLMNNGLGRNKTVLTKPPGFERPTIDYEQLKIRAAQAMQKPPKPTELRTPNSVWAGLGFSYSSPSSCLKIDNRDEDNLMQVDQDKVSTGGRDNSSVYMDQDENYNEISLPISNYLDSISRSFCSISNQGLPDLPTLLAVVGLEKYIPIFESHEVDFSTFKTLTESDLREIGVSAFGARRKLLFCIAELNRRQKKFLDAENQLRYCGSAAPGAERRYPSLQSLNKSFGRDRSDF